jgi:valyl-tRNA synthetase
MTGGLSGDDGERGPEDVESGAQIPLAPVGANAGAAQRMAENEALIRRLVRLASVESAEAAPKDAVSVGLEGATPCLPSADVIDVAAENARLEKAVAKKERKIKGFDAKPSNEKFVAKAPAEAERARLGAALARLAEIG